MTLSPGEDVDVLVYSGGDLAVLMVSKYIK